MKGLVLITGGSRGIGAATSIKLAEEGYQVCINYRENKNAAERLVNQITYKGGKAMSIQADISMEEEVIKMFSKIDNEFGSIIGLVNNAGIVGKASNLAEMSYERIKKIFEVNVIGTMLCSRESIKRMSTKYGVKGGSIINISSGASKLGSPNTYVDYASTKGAIDTFTIGLAKEVAEENIRVNAIRPGFIETEIHQIKNRLQEVVKSIPMKRVGQPEEIAETIVWLLSEKSSYTTGAIIDISGGK